MTRSLNASPRIDQDPHPFLAKYELVDGELIEALALRNRVFINPESGAAENPFRSEFRLIPRLGGLLLIKTELFLLKKCLLELGEEQLYILEDGEGMPNGQQLNFRFPRSITWEEMNSGGVVSFELLKRPIRNYFVFGSAGDWGKYAANDIERPIDLFGFSIHRAPIFRSLFEPGKKERSKLREWIPTSIYPFLDEELTRP